MTCSLPFHGPYVNIEAASNIVIEYEPHEKLTHTELLDEMHELRSWVEEGKALS